MAGNTGKRSGSAALEIALAVDVEVGKGRAQWWNPELKPQAEAHPSSVVEGADGAVSAWVADECDWALGQDSSPAKEEQHAQIAERT